MPRSILITGAFKADCIRIRNVLRSRFRQTVIQLDDAADLSSNHFRITTGESDGDNRLPVLGTDDLQKKIQRAEFLIEAGRILRNAMELADILSEVIKKSQDVLGDMAFLFDEHGGLVTYCPPPTKAEDLLHQMTLFNEREPLKSIALNFLRFNEPQLSIIGVTGNPSPDLMELAQLFSVTSMISVPLISDALSFGVFTSFATGSRVFDASDLALAAELAEAIGRTIAQARELEDWKQKANTDPLTGVYNIRLLSEILTRQVARAERLARQAGKGERRKHQVAMLTLDIDDFKQVNDRYGHSEGSRVLKSVADILRSSVRTEDFIFRFSEGADEFAVILPDSDLDDGVIAAEHIRENVANEIVGPNGVSVTVSIGVSEYQAQRRDDPKQGNDETIISEQVRAVVSDGVENLQKQSDVALRAAKKIKNKVESYTGSTCDS